MRKTNISDIEHKRMTETPITRLVVTLSIPTVISMLMTSIYNMADTYFVSSLGDSPVGAVGIVFSLQSIIQAVGFGLSMGCGSLVSIKLGEKKNDEANKIFSSAFFTAFICGSVSGVASGLFLALLDHVGLSLGRGCRRTRLRGVRTLRRLDDRHGILAAGRSFAVTTSSVSLTVSIIS